MIPDSKNGLLPRRDQNELIRQVNDSGVGKMQHQDLYLNQDPRAYRLPHPITAIIDGRIDDSKFTWHCIARDFSNLWVPSLGMGSDGTDVFTAHPLTFGQLYKPGDKIVLEWLTKDGSFADFISGTSVQMFGRISASTTSGVGLGQWEYSWVLQTKSEGKYIGWMDVDGIPRTAYNLAEVLSTATSLDGATIDSSVTVSPVKIDRIVEVFPIVYTVAGDPVMEYWFDAPDPIAVACLAPDAVADTGAL